MIYFSLAFGLTLIIFLGFSTRGLWTKHVSAKMITGFLFPGTVVHELSHALLCLITGTTIKELNLFAANNTGIKYDKPKIPFVFDFIIVSAPIFGCAFFIFFISRILSNPIHINTTFPQEIHFTLKGLFDLIRHLIDSVWITQNDLRNQFRIGSIRHIIYILTMVIFTISMSPHKQDIKYLVLGFGILSLIFFFLDKAGMHLLRYAWWSFCIKQLWIITTLAVSTLATLLFITLITMAFIKGYRLTFGQKGSSK